MKPLIQDIEKESYRLKRNDFSVGDTICVMFRIVEGRTERLQAFEGLVISIRGEGLGTTFTVRKVSYNVGVERIFPLHSPRIDSVSIVRRGKVRRAKLYYIRQLAGKKAKVKEKIVSSKSS